MNPLSLVWDVLFVDSAITDTKSAKVVAAAMEEATAAPAKIVMNWNTVMKGQKTSGAGFTSGLRFVFDLAGIGSSEVTALHEQIGSFSHELSALSNVHIAESIPFPIDRRTKSRFPSVGRVMLEVRFTHGLGYTESKKIANAISTQTKETKEGLNPLERGKGGNKNRFNEEFLGLMSDPYWFRVFPCAGERPSEINVRGGADGGMYDLAFDLRGATRTLTETSEGTWWEPLNPEELTLTPRLLVNIEEELESPYDPSRFHHHDKGSKKLIENVAKVEMEQTGDESVVEELTYTLERLVRGWRNPRQLTEQHGLVSGIEESLVENEVMLPWIAEEFVACLGFFLMTRKPKYWRNGASQIHLLHEFSEELIESLIEV